MQKRVSSLVHFEYSVSLQKRVSSLAHFEYSVNLQKKVSSLVHFEYSVNLQKVSFVGAPERNLDFFETAGIGSVLWWEIATASNVLL